MSNPYISKRMGSVSQKHRTALFFLIAIVTLLLGMRTADAETITYIHTDILGSPIAASDEQGDLVWQEWYTPYGSQVDRPYTPEDNARWYTGKPFEEDLNLSYFGARWYDPAVGRFMAIDPVDVIPENLHSFNRYAYGNNNPYRYVDPDGEFPVIAVALFALDVYSGYKQTGSLVQAAKQAALGTLNPLKKLKAVGRIFRRGGGEVAKGATELSKSAQKGIRSLEKRIAEHEKKLADFKANPTVRPGMEGQPESVIKAAQQSRIRHLEKEIQTFKENIDKLQGGQ